MSLQQALIALRSGQAALCETTCRRILANRTAPADQARLLLGLALAVREEKAESLALLLSVARTHPRAAHPFRDLAGLMHGRDDAMEALLIAGGERAAEDANLAIFHAEWLELRGRKQAAEARLVQFLTQETIKEPAGEAAVLRAYALLLSGRNALPAAGEAMKRATSLEPNHAAGWTNLANILTALKDFPAAQQAHDRAAACAPNDPRMRMNRALTLLKAGRYAEGWADYEARLAIGDRLMFPVSSLLRKEECRSGLDGVRILVVSEQGFGDTIQFLRYIPLLAARGARVRLFVPPELVTVAETVAGVESVTGMDGIAPAFDRHVPMMSLPYLLDAAFVPMHEPYLAVSESRVRHWQTLLPSRPARGRIGLVWAGASRNHPDATAIDRRRSMSLQDMALLADIPDMVFVNLQMGPPSIQAQEKHAFRFAPDITGQIRDFADSAAILSMLDALVTVDTSIAHLAGALGVPVLMLDRMDHCWRWSDPCELMPAETDTETGGLKTRWYPSMQLFRQTTPMDWQEPVRCLHNTLRVLSLQ
ncbi:Tetratricopeptide repeat family protein [Granulibacter bethesdensis]|uniref:Tetratricopeptide repeat family protein n=1 Tax=Granulibacter bethesdensis TaxID=364410 RepID=A0AAN0RCW9_9PROT|nr:tetratricopeptide repeat protein [Granulibacter bethesdensis]AHJ62466.1 Tetratricopeptide repeat family protein [Granulibacter bethesdensis]